MAGLVGFAALVATIAALHDPSRHELQAFLIARGSDGLLALFKNLGHEGHPGLWHLILLAADRLSDGPLVLCTLQALIAVAILALLWLASPFPWLARALLSLSVYFAVEYTVAAPGYGAGVVLLLAFAALADTAWAWVALGLLANVGVHFMALAAILGALLLWRGQRSAPGIAIALLLGLLALATAYPAAGTVVAAQPGSLGLRAMLSLARLSAALLPVNLDWPRGLGWERLCAGCNGTAPLTLGLLAVLLGALSLGRQPALALAYLATAAALHLIGALVYLGYDRHYGLLFVMLVVLHWLARRALPRERPSALLLGWLTLSAALGLWALYGAAANPRSDGRAAALWLAGHIEKDAVIAAYPAWMEIEPAAYLEREIYNLQAGRFESFVRWDFAADHAPETGDLALWLKAAPQGVPLYLVNDPSVPLAGEGAALAEVARLGTGYVIYRVGLR